MVYLIAVNLKILRQLQSSRWSDCLTLPQYQFCTQNSKGGRMRKIIVLVVAACFVACAATVYAQEQAKERNLIKIIQKSVERQPTTMKNKDKLRGDIAKVTMFQSSANWINEGSARARGTPSQKEQNLITIVQGTLKSGEGKEKNMVKGDIGKVENFQSAANWICGSSAKCRGVSSPAQETK